MLVVAIVLILFVVWLVHLLVPETPSRTPMATGFVSIVVAAIFGVALNNLYALKRDRDGRVWNVRQQHLDQLRPVLKQESDQLAGLAQEFHVRGFLEGEHGGVRSTAQELAPFLEPNVMSFDLANHYPEYAQSKQRIEADIVNHDRSFSSAVTEAQSELGVHDISSLSAERLADTFLVECMARGQGFTLKVTPRGQSFSVSYYGATISGSGPVSSELVYFYRRYRAFRPSQSLKNTCDSLRSSADAIEKQARDLSKSALLQEQETTLRGNCSFVGVN